MKDLKPRYGLEEKGVLVQIETEAAMIHLIQHELPLEVVEIEQRAFGKGLGCAAGTGAPSIRYNFI